MRNDCKMKNVCYVKLSFIFLLLRALSFRMRIARAEAENRLFMSDRCLYHFGKTSENGSYCPTDYSWKWYNKKI